MTRAPGFSDHFSSRAADYARFRPRYPAALFEWIATEAPACRVAWDCATGNGQAAVALAARVPLVLASDASVGQLRAAERHPRVRYLACTAEHAALRSASVELVTVAQALHWLDAAAFAREATRVLVPGGLVVAWTYGDPTLGPELDDAAAAVIARVRPHWPAERAGVGEGYRRIAFPFREVATPALWLEQAWTREQFVGYAGTWSAARPYAEATGGDVMRELRDALAPRWADDETRMVRWPMVVRAGRPL